MKRRVSRETVLFERKLERMSRTTNAQFAQARRYWEPCPECGRQELFSFRGEDETVRCWGCGGAFAW